MCCLWHAGWHHPRVPPTCRDKHAPPLLVPLRCCPEWQAWPGWHVLHTARAPPPEVAQAVPQPAAGRAAPPRLRAPVASHARHIGTRSGGSHTCPECPTSARMHARVCSRRPRCRRAQLRLGDHPGSSSHTGAGARWAWTSWPGWWPATHQLHMLHTSSTLGSTGDPTAIPRCNSARVVCRSEGLRERTARRSGAGRPLGPQGRSHTVQHRC
jgi:hypothetical protein